MEKKTGEKKVSDLQVKSVEGIPSAGNGIHHLLPLMDECDLLRRPRAAHSVGISSAVSAAGD